MNFETRRSHASTKTVVSKNKRAVFEQTIVINYKTTQVRYRERFFGWRSRVSIRGGIRGGGTRVGGMQEEGTRVISDPSAQRAAGEACTIARSRAAPRRQF